MVTRRLATHNVIGVFPTYDAAEDALEALLEAGFRPRGELSLIGPEHEMRPAVEQVIETRGEGASGTARNLVAGAGAGGLAGSVLVALGAVAATAIPGVGMAIGTAALAGAAVGASGGGTVGALMGLEAAGRRTTMWQQTLSPLYRRVRDDGIVLVAVHVDEDDRAAQARHALESRAMEVHDLAADIDYQPELFEANVGVTVPSGNPDRAGGAMGPGKEDHPQPNT